MRRQAESRNLKTTRDEPDYDKLMRWRLGILKEHGLGLKEIQATIEKIDPLPGAREFLDELRTFSQVILISDTFTEFAAPLMKNLAIRPCSATPWKSQTTERSQVLR